MRLWNLWVSVSFLQGYCHRLGQSEILPGQEEELRVMLEAYLLNHMLAELGRELKRQPNQLRIPLRGILYMLGEQTPASDATLSGPKASSPSLPDK